MQLLASHRATRISIGVQSFIESEVAAASRAQKNAEVETAITHIRAARIPTLNLDLIYGLPTQTVASWKHSLKIALSFSPEELYLYPLYVRPLTGIARRDLHIEDHRAACYAAACEILQSAGYQQLSMRMFSRIASGRGEQYAQTPGPIYCCQDDGMVGLGCGARSYTRSLHYSREFAVGRESVKSILHDYVHRPASAFDVVDYGCPLSDHEQRRRYIIKSILRFEGLFLADYRARFAADPLVDVPELASLIDAGHLAMTSTTLMPTQKGIDHSDAIGPALFSSSVRSAMEEFDLR